MNDSAAERQIEHMISFIRKEAEERVEEINVKTETEFTAEKQRLVERAKLKLREEFAARRSKALVSKRIQRSAEINKARLRKMEARESVVRAIKEEARSQLIKITKKPNYAEYVKSLIVQGLIKMMDEQVVIRCTRAEEPLVRSVLDAAIAQYKQIMKDATQKNYDVEAFVQPILEEGNGVVMSGLNGRVLCDNTLEARLNLCFEELKPQIRNVLFPAPPPVQSSKPKQQNHGHGRH